MTILLLSPTFLVALIMAEHFLRDSYIQSGLGATFASRWDLFMVAMALLLPFLLLIRRRAVLHTLQLLLLLAAVDLLLTGYDIVQQRLATRNPDVLPPGIIMAATAAFCLFAAALLQAQRLHARYPQDRAPSTTAPIPPAPAAASRDTASRDKMTA